MTDTNNEKRVHEAKINKYENTLPTPSEEVSELLDLTSALSTSDMNVLHAHLGIAIRRRGVTTSSTPAPTEGAQVKIVSGDPRYIGIVGTATRVRRARSYVTIPGRAKPLYLFTTDLESLEQATTFSLDESTVSEDEMNYAESATG